MNRFSPELLDDADGLLVADRGGMLRALASAGAQVRRAAATADESGIGRLRSDDPPRAVLVACDAHAPYLSSLLDLLGRQRAPIIDWREPVLPNWAGPADALLVVSADGRHPRLAELAQQADRRALAVAVVAPEGSPVATAAPRHPVADVSYLSAVTDRAIWWALATPTLIALDVLGLSTTTPLLDSLADALDEVAETNRPDSSPFTGPAKVLAADLADAVPVIAGAGSAATVAARRIAAAVQLVGGSTAMAASLPDDVARVGSLLEFASGEGDFFADRAEFDSVLPRLVLVGEQQSTVLSELGYESYPTYGEQLESPGSERGSGARYGRRAEPGDVSERLGAEAARRAGEALAELASSRGIGCSRIDVPEAPPLIRFAIAAAVGDFAACYLALARGIDPSAPRLGELSH